LEAEQGDHEFKEAWLQGSLTRLSQKSKKKIFLLTQDTEEHYGSETDMKS
jgi:hypothetical protein